MQVHGLQCSAGPVVFPAFDISCLSDFRWWEGRVGKEERGEVGGVRREV